MKPHFPSNRFIDNYIFLVEEDNIQLAFEKQQIIINGFLKNMDEDKSRFSYAPGKWTLKELLQHILDTERVFAYRALCIARKDENHLPGFDENEYANHSLANERPWVDIVEEFLAHRKSVHLLFKGFSSKTLMNTGFANNNLFSVGAIGFAIVGHFTHHINVMKEKYGLTF